MINEIYVNGALVLNEYPKKQFKSGYKIRCVNCKEIIERHWYDKRILEVEYECKKCVLLYKNPMYNPTVKVRHSEIVKSEEYREKLKNACSGEKNGFYGKSHNRESVDVIIQKNKIWFGNLTERDRNSIRKKMSDGQKKSMKNNPSHYRKIKSKAARVSHISQFYNKKMNKIETKVYDYVKSINSSVKFSVMLASYQFDFGIKDKKILIEVDGDYWHGNPKYYNKDGSGGLKVLNGVQLAKISKDEEKMKWATSRGFTVLRIWEDEVNNGTFMDKLNGYL
jgi:very-short-patch-repair endonuclease